MDWRASRANEYYRTHYAHFMDCSPRGYDRMTRRYRFIFGEILPKDKNARILDIGCGPGHFLYFLKKQGYPNIQGIDRSEDQLRLCRERVGVPVRQQDAVDFLLERPGQFDLISALNVLEHLPLENGIELVCLILRALRSGGRVVLAVPNAANPYSGGILYGDLTHCLAFTSMSLRQLFAMHGVTDVQFYRDGAAPSDFLATMRWLLAVMQESVFKLGFLVSIGVGRGSHRHKLILSPEIVALATKP